MHPKIELVMYMIAWVLFGMGYVFCILAVEAHNRGLKVQTFERIMFTLLSWMGSSLVFAVLYYDIPRS